MRKLQIGYWPLSKTLNSAGDRRRLIFWANARGHTVVTDLNQSVDVIIASENSDFNSLHFTQKHIPVIFDLVDAYLSPLNPYDDLARGFAKRISGQISGGIKPFSQHIRDFCLRSNAVICSSIEQAAVIRPFNSNIHVILDSHEEIPLLKPRLISDLGTKRQQILWEGQPATIRGVAQISSILADLVKNNNLQFNFVTDERYFKIMNNYVQRNTMDLLKKDLGQISSHIQIIPWTLQNLVNSASISSAAMIPINLRVPIQQLKPENRLLIMWRLGLPCLTSKSPAYARVAKSAGVNAVCDTPNDWRNKFMRLVSDPEFALEEVARGQEYLYTYHHQSILLKKWDLAISSVLN